MCKIFLAGSFRYVQEKNRMQEIKDKLVKKGHEVWWCPEKIGTIYGVKGERVKEIVEMEKEQIEKSDYVVAVIDEPTPGTLMETQHAAEKGVQIIAISSHMRLRESPWFMYHVQHLVPTIEDAIELMGKKR